MKVTDLVFTPFVTGTLALRVRKLSDDKVTDAPARKWVKSKAPKR